MKNFILVTILLLAFSCHSQSDIFQQQEWVGQINLLGQWQYIQTSTKGDTVTLYFRDEGPSAKYLITNTKQEGNEINFDLKHEHGNWHFSGMQVENDRLEGTYKTRDLQGEFLFYKKLHIDKKGFQPYLGNFQLPSGGFLRTWQRGEYQGLHSAITQRYSGLKMIGEQQFLSASGEMLHFSDLQNGQYQKVEWQSPDGQKILAQKTAPIRIEDHLIVTSTDTIGASLYLPNTKGKHPACIIPIGAARYNRLASDMEAELFATYGIATLIYDNHGFGKSTGNLLEKSFVDKQQTAIELFRWLEKHPEIDTSKIGFRGGSQGGRIALMAASELLETAFLVLLATPMETRMDQQLYALSAFHRSRNHSEDAIARSTEVWRKFFLSVAHEKIDTAFVEEAHVVRNLYPNMELPNPNLDEPPYFPWRDDILNRTSDYLPTVKCPVLCLFGSLDDRVPPQKSIHLLQTGLEKAGQAPSEVIVYDGAGHSFMLPGFRIVEGLFLDQVRFMRRVVRMD